MEFKLSQMVDCPALYQTSNFQKKKLKNKQTVHFDFLAAAQKIGMLNVCVLLLTQITVITM